MKGFTIDPEGKQRYSHIGYLRFSFTPSQDQDLIDRIRETCNEKNVTPTELMRQMARYCFDQMDVTGEE